MGFELNFEQLKNKLKKVLNPSRFRFVVILYPNTNMIDEVKNHIKEIYPQSLVTNLDLKDKSYQDISNELYKNNEGFVYIDDFAQVLDNSDLYYGFNQRRDKIASYNINLICFISLYEKEKLFKKALNVIPDLWEFKNTVLELEEDKQTAKLSDIKIMDTGSYSSIGGLTGKDKRIELKKLLKKLDETKDDELKLNILHQITIIYRDIGSYHKSLKYLQIELKLKKQQNSSKNDLALSYHNISDIYNAMRNLEEALNYQKKALKIREEILEKKHPDLAASYDNISIIYKNMRNLEKALNYQKKALKIREEILGEKHPDLAISYNNISTIYKDMGEIEKALNYQKKDLEIIKEILGEKHPSLAISYANISQIYWGIKDTKKAKEYIDKAVSIYQELFPNGHPSLDTMLDIQKNICNKKN